MDKATVVSIYHREINERKCTLQPGIFVVPPGSMENPSTLVVGPSSWWREIDDEQPLLEIPTSAIQIAESVVKDWAIGLIGVNLGEIQPGVFYIPGEHDGAAVKKNFGHLLLHAGRMQTAWFQRLIQLADGLWARSSGNPIVVAEDMRDAARILGVQKDWMANFQAVEMVRCIACGTLRNPLFPVCAVCKNVVDPEKAKALDLKVRLLIS